VDESSTSLEYWEEGVPFWALTPVGKPCIASLEFCLTSCTKLRYWWTLIVWVPGVWSAAGQGGKFSRWNWIEVR
jgi:hypothetical protein